MSLHPVAWRVIWADYRNHRIGDPLPASHEEVFPGANEPGARLLHDRLKHDGLLVCIKPKYSIRMKRKSRQASPDPAFNRDWRLHD